MSEPVSLETIANNLHRVRDAVFDSPRTQFPHRLVIPYATYAPWAEDQEFLSVYKHIHRNTLVDIYRCYELWELAGQSSKMPGDVLEIGVWRGGTGYLIAARAEMISPDKTTFLCDTFSGVAKTGEQDAFYEGGEHADTSISIVADLFAAGGVKKAVLMPGLFPDDTGDAIEERKFCFCHIDVDVYQSARSCLEWVWPRLTAGGMVIFDDYGFYTCPGITTLVREFASQLGCAMIHNLNGHAVLVKTS